MTFPDGSRVGITGLGTIMEGLYRERKPAAPAMSFEMMELKKSQVALLPVRSTTIRKCFS